jgi:hypothetical protein
MKRLISSFVVVGAVLLMMAGSAQASGAGAVTMTQTFHNATQTFVPPDPAAVNPCTGVLGTLTITYNGVAHSTFLTSGVGAGTGWATFTATGTFTFVGVDGVTFTGRFTTWDGQNFNLKNFATTSTFVVHGTGSDGSSLMFHDVAHFSVSASGSTLSFDKPTCG